MDAPTGASTSTILRSRPSMTDGEFALFQAYVQRECAMALTADKKYLLESRLARLLAENGCGTFSDLYAKLVSGSNTTVRDRIVDAITTHETLWFRDRSAWEGLRDIIVPQMVQRALEAGRATIRIWSAACSTGQEPYSLAMLIDQLGRSTPHPGMRADQFEITATDISPSALFVAKAGRYDSISMTRGFEAEFAPLRERYFSRVGNISVIDPDLQARVAFKRFNLQDSFAPFGVLDLVLLRYVAIYFSDTFKRELFARLARVLRPAGVLILGAAESLLDETQYFTPERTGGAYCYRRSIDGRKP
jgi:chemotaxis protein methyltransferase CheR